MRLESACTWPAALALACRDIAKAIRRHPTSVSEECTTVLPVPTGTQLQAHQSSMTAFREAAA